MFFFCFFLIKGPSRKPAVCCCVVVAAAYTNRGGRPGLPNCVFKLHHCFLRITPDSCNNIVRAMIQWFIQWFKNNSHSLTLQSHTHKNGYMGATLLNIKGTENQTNVANENKSRFK